MARSDLIVALAAAALRYDADDVRRAVETISAEERRKGHGHVAERLAELLLAAPALERPSIARVESARPAGSVVRKSAPLKLLKDVFLDGATTSALQDVLAEQRHARELRAVGLEPRHRVLLVGPPGTGKTSLASALAGELGLPLRTVQYEAVIGSYLGETSGRLREMFDLAAEEPCVLFLDEFDTLAKERGDEHDAGEVKRVVSTLLLQLDALPSHVLLVAATNHDELLDRAAWRRFQVVIRLALPSGDERVYFARELAKRIGLSPSTDVQALSRAMDGQSYAAVEESVMSLRRAEIISAARAKAQGG